MHFCEVAQSLQPPEVPLTSALMEAPGAYFVLAHSATHVRLRPGWALSMRIVFVIAPLQLPAAVLQHVKHLAKGADIWPLHYPDSGSVHPEAGCAQT